MNDDNADIRCGEDFVRWHMERRERKWLWGAFSSGWFDARAHRSDFNRRRFSGDAREAYMAGRSYGRKVEAA